MEKERYQLKVAVYIILEKDTQILMLKRLNTGWNDGNFSFPAGHLEESETIENAILREAYEESGVTIQKEDLKLVHVMHRMIGSRIEFFFKTQKWSGIIQNKEPEKCSELSWFPINKLPQNIVSSVSFALENINKNIMFSEFKEL